MGSFYLLAVTILSFYSCKKDEIVSSSAVASPEVNAISVIPAINISAYYVSPSGKDTNPGTLQSPFKTLEKARDAMRSSSIKQVFLRSGIYKLTQTFILGEKDNNTVWGVYPADKINSTIIDGGGINDVIDIFGGSNITINGLTVRNFTSRGIGVHGGRGWPAAAPYFDKVAPAAARNIISNNIVENGIIPAPCWDRAGIYTEGATPGTLITNNVVRNTTGYGIGVWSLQNGDDISGTQVKNNVILNSGSTTKDGGAIYIIDGTALCKSISVTNNFIRDYGTTTNETMGIYLDNGLSNAAVEGNIISGKGTRAIMLHGGSNITVTKNIIDVGSAGDIAVLWCIAYESGKMINNKFVNNVIISANKSEKTTKAFLKSSNVNAPVITNNVYYDYSLGVVNTGAPYGELSDILPLGFDPMISGTTYNIANNSRLYAAPMNFPSGIVKYGPDGYTIPEGSSKASCLIKPAISALFLQAESCSSMKGVTKNGTQIDYCDDGDWLKFEKVDFGSGFRKFGARLAVDKGNAGKTIEVRLGSPTGKLVASLKSVSTGDFNTFKWQSTTMTQVSGVQDIYIVFKGGAGVGNFDSFKFE